MTDTLARILAWPPFLVLLLAGLILEKTGGTMFDVDEREPPAWWCVCGGSRTGIPGGMRCLSCGRDALAARAFLRGRYSEWTPDEPAGQWIPCYVGVQTGKAVVWELRAWQHLPDGVITELGMEESA